MTHEPRRTGRCILTATFLSPRPAARVSLGALFPLHAGPRRETRGDSTRPNIRRLRRPPFSSPGVVFASAGTPIFVAAAWPGSHGTETASPAWRSTIAARGEQRRRAPAPASAAATGGGIQDGLEAPHTTPNWTCIPPATTSSSSTTRTRGTTGAKRWFVENRLEAASAPGCRVEGRQREGPTAPT